MSRTKFWSCLKTEGLEIQNRNSPAPSTTTPNSWFLSLLHLSQYPSQILDIRNLGPYRSTEQAHKDLFSQTTNQPRAGGGPKACKTDKGCSGQWVVNNRTYLDIFPAYFQDGLDSSDPFPEISWELVGEKVKVQTLLESKVRRRVWFRLYPASKLRFNSFPPLSSQFSTTRTPQVVTVLRFSVS